MSRAFFRFLKLRWRGVFGQRHKEAELDREMKYHLDMLVAENIAEGMSPKEARFAALREFGGVEQNREACRDTWRPALVSGLLGDFAYAARSLRRSPGFTMIAAFTLALGIGVNAIIFSFVRDLILRPLIRDRELNLVALYNSRVGADRHFRFFSHLEFAALRASSEVFSDVAAMGVRVSAIGPERNLQRRLIAFVSENYFSLLGVQPAQGRFFNVEESRPGASIPVLVANYALWERLGRPVNFVGSTLQVEDRTYTVIGIAPPSFVGLHVSIGPDAWLPLGEAAYLAKWDLQKNTTTCLNLFARLRPELSLASAAPRLASVNLRLNEVPPTDRLGARQLVLAAPSRMNFSEVTPQDETEGFIPLFSVLGLGLSLTVLIVACLNLANMLLARGVARHKEIAIRIALGASRWQVIRGLLAEGLLIALLGGALSLALGQWSNDFLYRWSIDAFATGMFALSVQPFIDLSLVVATLGFSLVATLAFSLWPALRVTQLDLYPDLKQISGGPSGTGRNRFFSLGQIPLLGQIALSLTLLFSAALFIRSSFNAQTLELGFRPQQQLVALLDFEFAKLDRHEFWRRQQALLASAATIPGVTSAALASNVPYNFDLSYQPVSEIDGVHAADPDPKTARHRAGYTAVTAGYFATMGISLVRGRDFTAEEGAGTAGQLVAIIDESLANAMFGDADALGRHVSMENKSGGASTLEIVGIVRSPRDDVFARAPQRIYRPLGQSPETNTYLHLRVSEPSALIDALRRHLQSTASEAPVLFVRPLTQIVEKNINVLLVRMAGAIFGVFGGIALVIAVVGIYGVKAHAVARRTREIGVRVALGARPQDVMMLILKQGALQAAVGISLGLGLALLAGRALSAMLYRVDPADPWALIVSAVLLAASVLLACWLPARRATKVDPLVAIRVE